PAEKEEPPNEAEELAKHFHKVFHGGQASPTAKALGQAATLIARHGVPKARHIIDFAHREAPKTRHKIATFGGVMQYEPRLFATSKKQSGTGSSSVKPKKPSPPSNDARPRRKSASDRSCASSSIQGISRSSRSHSSMAASTRLRPVTAAYRSR